MARRLSTWDAHTLPSSFLSARLALMLFVGEVLIGIMGYMLIEQYNLIEAFYMVMITVSTVGYTEVKTLSDSGRLFTSFLILMNIGIFAYSISVFTYYVIQGEIFKKFHTLLINRNIADLRDHVIVCGYGRYGKEMSKHFFEHGIPFVVVDYDADRIIEIQQSKERILYVEDDATHDETLIAAGIRNAQAVISALPDDSDNVFIVLTARQLNPRIDIISRAKHEKTEKKLLKAGANHVVRPEQIGGFYMATLVSKPGAVEFFSFLTNEAKSDMGFEEITYESLPKDYQGKTIRELNIRRITGTNIIGFKDAFGNYIVNPSPEIKIVPNTSFIVLGDRMQLIQLKDYLEGF